MPEQNRTKSNGELKIKSIWRKQQAREIQRALGSKGLYAMLQETEPRGPRDDLHIGLQT